MIGKRNGSLETLMYEKLIFSKVGNAGKKHFFQILGWESWTIIEESREENSRRISLLIDFG